MAEEGETLLKGRLDITIVKDLLWVLTIESKRAGFSLIVGIPQVLSYMMAAPTPQKTLYGMVTNGRNFVFIKLERDLDGGHKPIYAQSKELIIDQDDDLEQVLRILKRIGAIAASTQG